MTGWIKLHRKIKHWEWYAHIPTRLTFIHLLLSVNYENGSWRGVQIKPGQGVFSLRKLEKEVGISIRSLRTAIKHLIETNVIIVENTNNYSLITVVNWGDYQDEKPTHELTTERHTERHTNRHTERHTETPVNSGLYENSDTPTDTQNDTRTDNRSTHELTPIKEDRIKEDRIKEFILNLNLNTGGDENFKNSIFDEFVRYWTKEIEDNSGQLRFELLPFFDYHKQVDLWLKNEKKFNKTKSKSHGSTRKEQLAAKNAADKRAFLEQLASKSDS